MTTNRALLALIAALSLAACDSSKDPLLSGGKGGGAAGAGTGGAAGSGAGGTTGSGGTTGTGGANGCTTVECLRPYECVRMCGGPIVRSSCCPCEAPLFDN